MGFYLTFDGGSGSGKGTIIKSLKKCLHEQGKSVCVLRENKCDPLRDYGAAMLPWCKKNEIDFQMFFASLYATGEKIAEKKALTELLNCDFLLYDRSFISTLSYRASTGIFTPKQMWDLYVNYMEFRVPDLAVIVDAPVSVALNRIKQRKTKDIGLGGKMSTDRERIRQLFLSIPNIFEGCFNAIVVVNDGEFTDDTAILNERIESVTGVIMRHLSKMEAI